MLDGHAIEAAAASAVSNTQAVQMLIRGPSAASWTTISVRSFTDLVDGTGKKFTVYNVEGRDDDGNYSEVQKRYTEFLDLRRSLLALQPSVSRIPFPQKTLLVSKDRDATKEQRRMLFDNFLSQMLHDPTCRPEVDRWLGDIGHENAKVFVGVSNIRRAFIDRRGEFIPPRDFDRIFDLMKGPTLMLKISVRSQNWRSFALSSDLSEVVYEGSRKAGGCDAFKVPSLLDVVLGQSRFRTRKSHLAGVSFSVVGTDRQLNLVCRHPHELRIWYLGLMELKRRIDATGTGSGPRHSSASRGIMWRTHGGSFSVDSPSSSLSDSSHGFSEGRSRSLSSASFSDEGSEGADDGDVGNYIWVTSETVLFTWGSSAWGQLGQEATPIPADATKSFPVPTLLNSSDVEDSTERPPAYIRSVCCRGNCTVVVNGFPRRGRPAGTTHRGGAAADEEDGQITLEPLAWCCGRELVASPVVHGSKGFRQNISNVFKPTPMIGLPRGLDVLMAACGDSHMLVLLSDGSVFSAGSNIYGQLGNGTVDEGLALAPVSVFGPSMSGVRAISISAGSTFSAAIAEGDCFDIDTEDSDEDDAVDMDESSSPAQSRESFPRLLYTWGDGSYGVLGHGDEDPRYEPSKVETFDTAFDTTYKVNFFQGTNKAGAGGGGGADLRRKAQLRALGRGAVLLEVSCGELHMALLVQDSPPALRKGVSSKIVRAAVEGRRSTNTIWTWGHGGAGQLGHGNIEDQHLPQPVEALSQKLIRQIACGAAHTAAIVDVDSNNTAQVLRGRVSIWGAAPPVDDLPPMPKLYPEYINFTKSTMQDNVAEQIACGDNFTAILDEDGQITVLGISPISGSPCQEQLKLPRTSNQSDFYDTEHISAGGGNLAIIMAHRHRIGHGIGSGGMPSSTSSSLSPRSHSRYR